MGRQGCRLDHGIGLIAEDLLCKSDIRGFCCRPIVIKLCNIN